MARGRIRSPGCAALMAMLAAASIATTVAATSARAAPPSESPTRAVCPGTFQVLHDDRVGSLRVSAGAYQITVASPARIPCATAAKNLSEFLRDFDGKIRRPWMIDVAQSTFQRGSDAAAAFQLARTGRPVGGGGTANPTSGSCPGFFRVRHDDHVGTLSLLKGAYRISLLDRKALSCAAAARRLTTFLQDFDGRIPRPWMLDNASATFMRGKGSSTGFRVKRAVGPEPKPSSGRRYPARGQPGECPGSLRVRHRDRIDKLLVPAGSYLAFAIKGSGLSCSRLTHVFRQFLARNATPGGYSLNAGTGTFLNRDRPTFRVKPASPRVSGQPATR